MAASSLHTNHFLKDWSVRSGGALTEKRKRLLLAPWFAAAGNSFNIFIAIVDNTETAALSGARLARPRHSLRNCTDGLCRFPANVTPDGHRI
jgi:hypothetical protein